MAMGLFGMGSIVDQVKEGAFKIEDLIKEQVIRFAVIALGKYNNNKMFLNFVEKTLTLVFRQPDASSDKRAEHVVRGYIAYSVLPTEKQDEYHTDLLECFAEELRLMFAEQGNLATATETVEICRDLKKQIEHEEALAKTSTAITETT